MTFSVRSLRRRVLECLERHELEDLSRREDADRRGRPALIDHILDNWTIEADKAVQQAVDKTKLTRG